MTSNIKERTTLATIIFIFAFAESILVLATAEALVCMFSRSSSGKGNLQTGWQLTMIVYAIIAVVFFYFTFAWTKERISPPKIHG